MRVRRLLRTVVFTALTCLAASVAFARIQPAAIEGTVTDKTGGVIPGARVTATHLESGFTKDTVAGPDGFYRFTLMRVGSLQRDRRSAAVRHGRAAAGAGERRPGRARGRAAGPVVGE